MQTLNWFVVDTANKNAIAVAVHDGTHYAICENVTDGFDEDDASLQYYFNTWRAKAQAGEANYLFITA